jgi:cytochrome P450
MITEFLVFIVVLVVSLSFLKQKPKNFPPGPLGFPILGHLPLLGQSPHKRLLEWKKTYGPVIGVWFGSYRTVVINDAKLIREALNMNAFSGRPPLNLFIDRSGGIPKGIIMTEGQEWVEQRRFTLKNLRDFGFGKNSMEAKIQDEIIELMDRFAARAGKPIQMRNAFNAAVVNALWSIMLGERLKQDDPELADAVHRLTSNLDESNPIASLGVFLPWFADIAPKLSGMEHMLKENIPLLNFIQQNLDKHKQGHVSGQPRDYADAYLDEVEKTKDPNSSFHEKQGHMNFAVLDLFFAGAETTSNTLTWMFAYLVTYPEIQEKFQKEIDEVVGKGRMPALSDRPHMRYTEALLNEVMRFSSLVPLSVFHWTTEDVELSGYNIPKGTMVMPNLYAAHFDEKVWGDPENFRPERFLDASGDPKKSDSLVPFSTGKRVCLGESLARDELFLFSTHLFQKFKASPAEKLPNLEPNVGVIVIPHPFEVVLNVR